VVCDANLHLLCIGGHAATFVVNAGLVMLSKTNFLIDKIVWCKSKIQGQIKTVLLPTVIDSCVIGFVGYLHLI